MCIFVMGLFEVRRVVHPTYPLYNLVQGKSIPGPKGTDICVRILPIPGAYSLFLLSLFLGSLNKFSLPIPGVVRLVG
jgi:hypothetical protein